VYLGANIDNHILIYYHICVSLLKNCKSMSNDLNNKLNVLPELYCSNFPELKQCKQF
jgi:hypothetical protein